MSQYATTVCGSHSGAETMFVRSFSVGRLKGPFHKTDGYIVLLVVCAFSACKSRTNFGIIQPLPTIFFDRG